MTYLPDNGAFEYDKHEQGEQTVIPILIETPEGDTEYLKDKERRCSVFAKELRKGRDGDVKFIAAIERQQRFKLVG